jgi:hypothetical protein
VSRQEVHVEELLRLPFPLPDALQKPGRAWEIVRDVSRIVTSAAEQAAAPFVDRIGLVRVASESCEKLIDEYFDILAVENALIEDTVHVTIPSVRPTRARPLVPTIHPSQQQRDSYMKRLCETLNTWARKGPFVIQGQSGASAQLGIGVAVLEKTRNDQAPSELMEDLNDVVAALERVRVAASQKVNSVELIRGVKIFDRNRLYIVKPIGQRFWTQTAALNDADEIAGTILMHIPEGAA